MTRKRPKPWRCKNGHVLGLAMENGSGVTELLVYRDAAEEHDGPIVEARAAVLYAQWVRCSICGDVRMWSLGRDALAALIEQMAQDELAALIERRRGRTFGLDAARAEEGGGGI